MRLRAVWLMVIPFLWLARPTLPLLAAGGAFALAGLALRAWAAGVIVKHAELSSAGPYAHTRNPLYLGSLLLGCGATTAGGRWIFVALFMLFFFLVYPSTMRREERRLEERFGDRYARYARSVPLFVPRLRPHEIPGETAQSSFRIERYCGNREYQALLGTVAAFAVLTAKMMLSG